MACMKRSHFALQVFIENQEKVHIFSKVLTCVFIVVVVVVLGVMFDSLLIS